MHLVYNTLVVRSHKEKDQFEYKLGMSLVVTNFIKLSNL